MALSEGSWLNHYEILGHLGTGGMGEVYRARDNKLQREVALKVLPKAFAQDPERVARFRREAQVLAQVNHPNIAAIYSVEESGGTHFLVMELAQGETLRDRIKRGPVPIEEALDIAKQIAAGLEAAHEKPIVHRDLKPANVKVTPDGVVKILDFGLARAFAGETGSGDPSDSPTLTGMTQTGVILGTAAYMSPEQARGKTVDKRTDIFALGCVLYEMLTGKHAFVGEDVQEILASVMKGDPDWTALPAATPHWIQVLLRRCLEKDAKRRLSSAADLQIQIEEALSTATSETPTILNSAPPIPFWRRALPMALAVVLAAVIASIAVWNLKPTSPQPFLPVTRMVVTLPADETFPATAVMPLAFSPDGSHLVYSAQKGNDLPRLYLRPMNSLEDQLLSGTDGADNPFFSPDGQWVGFFAQRELKKVPITGGAVLTICGTGGRPLGATWGADDRIIFSSGGGSGLLQVSAEGGVPEDLTSPEGSLQDFLPEILPGGNAVLFTTGATDGTIMAQRLDTGERKVLLEGGTFPHYVSTGHLVYNRAGSLLAVPFDPNRLEISGPPVPVIEGIRSPGLAFGVSQFTISRTGGLAYIAGSEEDLVSRLVWVDRQGTAEPLPAPPREYESPRLSPDGRRLAAGIQGNVWVYDIPRTTLTRQTFEGFNTSPVWSPDGKRLAFISSRGGPLNIFWQMADGSGGVEQLTTSNYQTAPASFSPDGRLLAFIEDNPGSGRAIRVLNLADHEAKTFLQTGYEETAPWFSPDGKWMLYTSTESGRREVYVQPYPGPGGKWQISTDGGQEPVWNPQGGELFYRSGNRMMAVTVNTESGFTVGTPQMLFEGPYMLTAGSVPFYNVSPDGKRFLMLEPVELQTGRPTQINVVLNWVEELKQRFPAGN